MELGHELIYRLRDYELSDQRQDHPKTAKSRRTVAVPSFAAEAIFKRLVGMTDHSPDALLSDSVLRPESMIAVLCDSHADQ